jgi:low affinity Fe/Cu permease
VNSSTSPGPGLNRPSRYARLARWSANFVGSPTAAFVLLGLLVGWLVVGALSDWARWWELVVTVGFPFLTLGLLMLLQHTQTHGNLALHLKLDEIIRTQHGASDELLRAEEASEEDLERYRERKLNSTFAERSP